MASRPGQRGDGWISPLLEASSGSARVLHSQGSSLLLVYSFSGFLAYSSFHGLLGFSFMLFNHYRPQHSVFPCNNLSIKPIFLPSFVNRIEETPRDPDRGFQETVIGFTA